MERWYGGGNDSHHSTREADEITSSAHPDSHPTLQSMAGDQPLFAEEEARKHGEEWTEITSDLEADGLRSIPDDADVEEKDE